MADDSLEGGDAVQALTSQMARLDQITGQFGRSLARALAAGVIQGKSFDDVLRSLGDRLIEISLKAAFKPLETGISGMLSGLIRGATGLLTGGITGGGGVFGDLFGGGNAMGGSGVFGGGNPGAGLASGVTVNMAVTTPDAESFKRSEAQIGAALARAVTRGQRNL